LNGFGLFNNDQIMLLGTSKRILAYYEDEQGEAIDGKVLSMVDYNINGAMSFPPQIISFNPNAKNALLLFATNGKKYLLRAEAFKAAVQEEATSYTFVMEDVTQKVRTAKALKKELGLGF
jgi:hypothetical protein